MLERIKEPKWRFDEQSTRDRSGPSCGERQRTEARGDGVKATAGVPRVSQRQAKIWWSGQEISRTTAGPSESKGLSKPASTDADWLLSSGSGRAVAVHRAGAVWHRCPRLFNGSWRDRVVAERSWTDSMLWVATSPSAKTVEKLSRRGLLIARRHHASCRPACKHNHFACQLSGRGETAPPNNLTGRARMWKDPPSPARTLAPRGLIRQTLFPPDRCPTEI